MASLTLDKVDCVAMVLVTLGLGINDPVVFGTSFHFSKQRMFTRGQI
jgi:hypothetical protein